MRYKILLVSAPSLSFLSFFIIHASAKTSSKIFLTYENHTHGIKIQSTIQIIETNPFILAGNPAHKTVFLASPGIGSFKIETMLVWMVNRSNVYTISFNSEQAEILTYVPTPLKMINTFEITNSTPGVNKLAKEFC